MNSASSFHLLTVLWFWISFSCQSFSSSLAQNQTNIEEVRKPPLLESDSYYIDWTTLTVTLGNKKLINFTPGRVGSSRVLGIIGPSGSGKSTFLKTLSDRLPDQLSLEGKAEILSIDGDEENMKGRKLTKEEVAYVYQDDNFFGMLTVRETLKLAIDLQKNSENKIKQEHDRHHDLEKPRDDDIIISDILRIMGLTKVANVRVGGSSLGGDRSHGISGGERKRLAVACELLSNPLILIADEPTSGLDSFQALQVMEILHSLARRRNMITICVVHQPRTTIWNLFDDVMVLTPLGEIAYFGTREEILPYFRSQGYDCPANTNPAEYLIDLVSMNTTSQVFSEASLQRAAELAKHYREYLLRSKYQQNLLSDTSAIPVIDGQGQSSEISSYKGNNFSPANHANQGKAGLKHHHAPKSPLQALKSIPSLIWRKILSPMKHSLVRFGLLFQRSARQLLRDQQTSIFRICISALLAFVVSGVYGYQGKIIKTSSIADRINIIAQGGIIMAMFSTIKTLQLFKREKIIIDRERSTNLYTSIEYLLAKSFVELPSDAFVGAIFGYVLYQKTALRAVRWKFISILSLLSAVCSSLGLAIGALAPSGDIALTLGPGLMVVYVIMGAIGPAGVSDRKLPAALAPFRYFSPMKWACEALCALEFKGQEFNPVETNPDSKKQSINGNLLHTIGSIISRPFQSLIQRFKGNHGRIEADGDKVLQALGIPDATFEMGLRVLGKMLLSHLGLALFGLIISRSKGF